MKINNLVKSLIKDLIIDIRLSKNRIKQKFNTEEEILYKNRCEKQLLELWKNRHNIIFDKNGWPALPTFQERPWEKF